MLTEVRRGASFIAVSRDYTNPSRWALVESVEPLRILNKPADLETSELPAIIGVYHLEGVNGTPLPLEDTEISEGLAALATAAPPGAPAPEPLVEVQYWVDRGHMDNYYGARKKFNVTRHFNRIDVDAFANLLTKTSDNRAKLVAEIDWYAALPAELKWVIPTV